MNINNPNRRRSGQLSDDELLEVAEKQNRTEARELADITTEWENLEWEGKKVGDKQTARTMYEAHKWMRQQLVVFLEVRANYAGNASKP